MSFVTIRDAIRPGVGSTVELAPAGGSGSTGGQTPGGARGGGRTPGVAGRPDLVTWGRAGGAERWREVLEFERTWGRSSVAKQAAIRRRFGVSPARYYQALNRLIDRPEAVRYDPVLVRRLRRLREARRSRRVVRRVGPES
jgi:Protein of unknown function (DUF3263)